MAREGVDTVSFLSDVDQQVEDITGILFFESRNSSERLKRLLEECRNRMYKFIESHHLGIEKKLYVAELTIALKQSLERSIRERSFPPNKLFDVVEQSFHDLFESRLILPRGQPPSNPVNPMDHGDAPGPYFPREHNQATGPANAPDSSDPVSGGGISQDQYTILHNLHKRLSALEQRMGVN